MAAQRTPSSTPQAPAMPERGGDPMNDAYILSWINYHANQPGSNPSLRSDPAYWLKVIKESGGWSYDKPRPGVFGYDVESPAAYWGSDRFYRTSDWGGQGTVLGGQGPAATAAAAARGGHRPSPNATPSPGRAFPRGTAPGDVTNIDRQLSDAAYASIAAAERQRNKNRGLGRQSTILGGFGAPPPSTRMTVAGGY